MCQRMLTRKYKFYLALENSICDEYVTEKFARAIESYTVPVVFRTSVGIPYACSMYLIDFD